MPRLYSEQIKLLYHDEYEHFVQITRHDGLQWRFGRVFRIEEWLARQLSAGGQSITELVPIYYEMLANLLIPARIYDIEKPGGWPDQVVVTTCAPIPSLLFEQLSAHGFDLITIPETLMNQLEEVIRNFITVSGEEG